MPSVRPQAAAAPQGADLGELVQRLAPLALEPAYLPTDVEVGEPVILDPLEEGPPPAAALVLAVGVATEDLALLLDRLSGAAAVVVKGTPPLPDRLVEAATRAGIAVLLAPPAVSWGHLYALLQTAVAAPPAGGAEPPLGDLFALANAVAAMVGGATTIEDPQNHVLAYSNLDHPIDLPRQQTILGRQVPADWIRRLQDAGVFRRLWQSNDVIRITDFLVDDYRPRLAIAVRAGGELLGSIWVIEGAQPLGAEAERALRAAADLAVLHLLRYRSASDVERRQRAETLLAALAGTEVEQAAAGALGLAGTASLAVVAFDVRAEGEAEAVMAAQRVADLATVYSESYRRQAVCAAAGRRVYALVPADEQRGEAPAVSFAQEVVDRSSRALHLPVLAGIGSAVAGLDQLRRSREEADQVLEVLPGRPRLSVASFEQVKAQVVLRELRRLARGLPQLRTGRLGPLVDSDRAKGTAWVPTLRAYFDAHGDMAVAAGLVNVHPNTFRYRLRRIVEVFGLDLDDPDERLVAELQLRFLDG